MLVTQEVHVFAGPLAEDLRLADPGAGPETLMRSALIIAHRLSHAAAADTVVVLDDGRVVEQGTHGELVAAGGT